MDIYSDPKRQRGEYMMACQSVALAGGVMLLAAHAEGLGGVWVCAPLFAQETVRQVFDLPDSWEAQGLLLMGYPEVIPPPRARLTVEKVSRFL
jgi:nitroreductase